MTLAIARNASRYFAAKNVRPRFILTMGAVSNVCDAATYTNTMEPGALNIFGMNNQPSDIQRPSCADTGTSSLWLPREVLESGNQVSSMAVYEKL